MIIRLAKMLIPSPLRPFARRLYRQLMHWNQRRRFADGFDSSVLQCRIAYNVHGGYCVPLSSRHLPMVQAILAGEVFETQTIEYLASQPASKDLVHAGAFFGDFLPALSHSRRDGAKVWAFEPNYESYRCALITLALNDLKNVSLANAALGAECSRGSLVIRGADGLYLGSTSHMLAENDIPGGPSASIQKAEIVTLDSVIPEDRYVAAIHFDVEGFETQALRGALNTIRRCLPVIILETMPNEDWLAENLWRLGYRMGPRFHYNTVLIPESQLWGHGPGPWPAGETAAEEATCAASSDRYGRRKAMHLDSH